MAVAFVQEKTAYSNNNVNPVVITLTSGVTSGNTLLVSVQIGNSPRSVSTISGCGATWTQVTSGTDNGGHTLELWKGVGATTGSTITITFTGGASYFSNCHAAEFSGASGGVTGLAANGSSIHPATASESLAAGDIAFGFSAWQSNPSTTNADTPSAWTALTGTFDVAVFGFTIDVAYRLAAGSESAVRSTTLGTTEGWGALSAKLAATGPAAYRRPAIHTQSRAVTRAAVI